MKKIYTCVAAICCCLAAAAQTEKGNWMVGGNFELNTVSNNTTISLNPTAGVFVINNLALGGTVDLSYSKLGENRSTTFGIGPLARYYFGKSNFRPYLHGDLNFVSQKFKFPTGTNTENGIGYFLAGGIAAFLNRNVAVEALAGYQHTKLRNIEGDGGFALRIGFQVYLSPRDRIERVDNQ
ncbi:MAG TPA: outer membrane beta-barrel protein [Chitinophagaceae bacterium]|nr:outer membrane beta-barrel protein [Chitinophagaceae bacterium]